MAMACLTHLLFLLCVGVTVSTVVDLQKRIIGGVDCRHDDRHYHVRLRTNNGTHETFCGGSLISDQWILTAAHCQIPGWTMFADLRVHPGPARTVQITDPPVTFRDSKGKKHDIMLVKLPSQTQTQTVQLPNCRNRPKLGDTVQIAGHASSVSGPNNERQPGETATLQCADTTIVGCQHMNRMKNYHTYAHEKWMCGQKPGVDTCKGDSGGGVVYQKRIYGVISKCNANYTLIAHAI
ncbi:anionic trypsin-2-like [Solea solea]|uniref:anionic trypsin-2-like n=1 Tax=Solea solea TaxID=90069 RepID=UPI00272B48D6|nr:anionic trypsin-2-like [Solea solea]